jgi:hypothetical protein
VGKFISRAYDIDINCLRELSSVSKRLYFGTNNSVSVIWQGTCRKLGRIRKRVSSDSDLINKAPPISQL